MSLSVAPTPPTPSSPAAAPAPAGSTTAAGTLRRLGPYELRAKIGEGGMAAVYLGHTDAGRTVALKVIKDEFSLQPEFTNMFLDEAKIVSRLSHPNIVHVEELGKDGKRLYLAMELLSGQSLWHVWSACRDRGVRLRYELVAWIGAQVAAGLHHAHELEIDGVPQALVHRDVNASNIIVGYDGTVKVIDFGLAKARGRIIQTAAGVVKGKLAYMSPEQAVGKPLDRRTDIFALATTLWELSTDRRLFKGTDDVDTLKRVYAAKIPDPLKLIAGYPAELWDILHRGLKRHADERWPDAKSFSEALLAFASEVNESTVAAAMDELFADQRARQEKWMEDAVKPEVAPSMETLRPPRVEERSPSPASVRPSRNELPEEASKTDKFQLLFLASGDLSALPQGKSDPPAAEESTDSSAQGKKGISPAESKLESSQTSSLHGTTSALTPQRWLMLTAALVAAALITAALVFR